MKKILILGAGVQGTTVAKHLDFEPSVEKIILASRNEAYVKEIAAGLTKVEGVQCDAHDEAKISELIKGCDLVVNALPVEYGKIALEAALREQCNYQDFAACEGYGGTWEEGIELMLTKYNEEFRKIGKLALMGTGSTPGLMCVMTRQAVEHLDTCDEIMMAVYEGVEAKRFQPFWWSPEVAINDMFNPPIATIDGKITNVPPYSHEIIKEFDYIPYPVRLVDHAHEEPFFMGWNKDTFFKGVKDVHFKYGGVGVEFSQPLYEAGKLSLEPEADGTSPRAKVLATLPRPPKTPEELKEILDEGLARDDGAFMCELTGTKDGRKAKVETHATAPGLAESFERAGISAEQYLTGLGGFMFTKMFVRDQLSEIGLISTDMLTEEENTIYMGYMNEIGITTETTVEYID